MRNELIAPGTSLNQLAIIINDAQRQIDESQAVVAEQVRISLESAKDAGDSLNEIKGRLGHGKWMNWVEANCRVKRSQVATYRKIASNWDWIADQITSAGNLTISGATKLIDGKRDKSKEETADQISSDGDWSIRHGVKRDSRDQPERLTVPAQDAEPDDFKVAEDAIAPASSQSSPAPVVAETESDKSTAFSGSTAGQAKSNAGSGSPPPSTETKEATSIASSRARKSDRSKELQLKELIESMNKSQLETAFTQIACVLTNYHDVDCGDLLGIPKTKR